MIERGVDASVDALCHDRAVGLCAAREAIGAIEKRGGVKAWVVDDTGVPKQGKGSVGVQRQHSGTLGKIGNCQIGVSLSVATDHEHVPIDFALYLPESWAGDDARRRASRIPDDVGFATKVELAIEMMAFKEGIPGDVVLADAAYGASGPFHEYVLSLGKDFACGIQGDCLVHLFRPQGRRKGEPPKASDTASELGRRAVRRVTCRHGSKGKMAPYFCLRRVKIAGPGEPSDARNTPLWPVEEWPEGEARPTKLALKSLGASVSKREVVRVLKERWRAEQAYAELKGELGPDHFEGRSFPAWHHHITVVLSCYAFLVAERSRRFPPSEAAAESDAHAQEAGTASRGLARVDATHPRQGRHPLARDLSAMWPQARCGRERAQELSDQGTAPAGVLGDRVMKKLVALVVTLVCTSACSQAGDPASEGSPLAEGVPQGTGTSPSGSLTSFHPAMLTVYVRDTTSVEVAMSAQNGASTWSLVAKLNAQGPPSGTIQVPVVGGALGQGAANVALRDASGISLAASGEASITFTPRRVTVQATTTPASMSADFSAELTVTCWVPQSQLAESPAGGISIPGAEVLVEDTAFASEGCRPFAP